MVSLGDMFVNNALELASDESSASVGVGNLKLIDLLYALNFLIPSQNASHGSLGSGWILLVMRLSR